MTTPKKTPSSSASSSAGSHMTDGMRTVKRHSIVDKFVISEDPVPKVPLTGARIKVCYAGACYVEGQVEKSGLRRPRMSGVQDTSLFPGFEVSGVVDELGSSVSSASKVRLGDRVVIYPRDKEFLDVGFAQYVTVKDTRDLIVVPDTLQMEVAAILPSGALRSYSAVLRAKPFIEAKIKENTTSSTNVLIVGAGGMGLWTLKLANDLLSGDRSKVRITVADTNIQKLMIAKDQGCHSVIHWNDSIHEEYILARTKDVCSGVDIAIDFVSSVRTIGRIIKVLNEEGVIIVGGNSQSLVTVDLTELSHRKQSILGVDRGTVEQLEALVQLLATGRVKPPIYTVYPVEEANKVFDLLNDSKIDGRAILRVQAVSSRQKVTNTVSSTLSFIHSFIQSIYIAPLQETTQRRSEALST